MILSKTCNPLIFNFPYLPKRNVKNCVLKKVEIIVNKYIKQKRAKFPYVAYRTQIMVIVMLYPHMHRYALVCDMLYLLNVLYRLEYVRLLSSAWVINLINFVTFIRSEFIIGPNKISSLLVFIATTL